MQPFTVVWTATSLAQLAGIYVNSTRKKDVTADQLEVDRLLRTHYASVGESRGPNRRILLLNSFIVVFDILHDDCQVKIHTVLPPLFQ